MTVKKWYLRLTKLLTLLCLVLLPAAVFAAPDSKTIFDCEQKAATFTRKMGKPGNADLFKQHLQECLDVSVPSPVKPTFTKPSSVKSALSAKTDPPAPSAPCPTTGAHRFTFINTSGEKIWIGAWDAAANGGTGGGVTTDNWTNWELESGNQNSWCAPAHFNGRFIIRARCNTATGVCEEGNCCNPTLSAPNNCSDMKCNIGTTPATLAEFTFDDKNVTWYDVSYVDGYNVPVMIQSNDPNKCETLGQGPTPKCDPPADPPTDPKCYDVVGTLPDCPWPTTNGVCLGPYLQYALTHPWHDYEQEYYTLAAKCAGPGSNLCGCGDQCWDGTRKNRIKDVCQSLYPKVHPVSGEKIDLKSSGCSPFNTNYRGVSTANPQIPYDQYALEQVVCDPFGKNGTGPNDRKMNVCNADLKWPTTPVDYTQYVQVINPKNPKAYTWQYHDDDSLTKCKTEDDQSFTITIGKRTASSKGNAYALNFNSDKTAKGKIYLGTDPNHPESFGTPSTFTGGNPQQQPVIPGNKVKIENQCTCPTAKITSIPCTGTFKEDKGLVSDDTTAGSVCNTPGDGGINWGTGTDIPISAPSGKACGCRSDNFVVHQGDKFHAQIWIKDADGGNPLKLADIGDRTKATDPYSIPESTLKGKPKVTLTVDCMNYPAGKPGSYPTTVKTVTCNTTYNDATGRLKLDNDGNCMGAAGSLGFKPVIENNVNTLQSDPEALSPGIPSDAVCQ